MTVRSYRFDPYRSTFTARVVSLTEGAITLDHTYFRPPDLSGGACDLGTIDGIEVVDVSSDEFERVIHWIRSERDSPPSLGTIVTGAIDWSRRYAEMRRHTARHLAELALRSTHDIVGITPREAALDVMLRSGDLDIAVVGEWVHSVVTEDLPTSTTGGDGRNWVWHLDGYGHAVCDGLHVSSTGEVGAVLLKQGTKTELRVELLVNVGATE